MWPNLEVQQTKAANDAPDAFSIRAGVGSPSASDMGFVLVPGQNVNYNFVGTGYNRPGAVVLATIPAGGSVDFKFSVHTAFAKDIAAGIVLLPGFDAEIVV